MGIKDSKIDDYINKICSHVRYKQAHKEIKMELLDHLEENIEELMKDGMDEQKAAEKALLQMGDAEVIGKQLNESHKAVPEIGIIILTVLLSLIGIATAYFIVTNEISSVGIFYKSALFNILGYCIIAAMYLFDYRILEKYSKRIYIIVTLVLFLQIIVGNPINGAKRWIALGPLSVDITEVSLFLYSIALSKILKELKWDSIKQVIGGLIIGLAPVVLYIDLKTTMSAVIYMVLFLTLMILTKSKLRYIISTIGVILVSAVYFIISEPYRLNRFLIFLKPEQDPQGAGYVNFQMAKLLNSVGFFGHGFTFPRRVIPEVQNDFVLTYIIYTFGWIAGITVIVLAFVFIARMFIVARKVKDSFGSLIIQGFMCIFALEFIWNILMILGLVPIVAVSLPFISYGGTRVVTQMLAIGIILSIYRRKNLSNITVKA